MGDMMGMMYGFSVIIFLVVIYLLSKVIIEKKCPGDIYDKDSRLYRWRNQPAVYTFHFSCGGDLPAVKPSIERQIMEVLFREMMLSSISGWITMWVDPMIYVKNDGNRNRDLCSGSSAGISEIRHVPMDEALKKCGII